MRSFIIIEVEHGEDTNAFELLLNKTLETVSAHEGDSYAYQGDYTVVVDLPPYITTVNAPTLIQRTS